MSSAPTTPQPNITTINVTDAVDLAERSSSTLDHLVESPSRSASVRSAPDTNHDDAYYEDILATIEDTEITLINRSSPSLQQNGPNRTPTLRNTRSEKHNKKNTKKARRSRHKKTASLSSADTPNGMTKPKKRLKAKPLKKVHKSVGFADNDREEHKQNRKKKVRIKKRKSCVTPKQILEKDLERCLSAIDQYLLPVPRKQAYYKWTILDPSSLKSKCKKGGTLKELLESLNANIQPSTGNIALIQSHDLLICLSNISSTAPIIVRTHCTHSIESIKEYFRTVCNISIPIRSYESKLNETSLADLLSSAREQKFLKAHKSRSANHTRGHGIPRKISKNTRWELDLTHKETNKLIHRLHDPEDSGVDWIIFDFKDYKKNTKYLVISAGEYGNGGSEALSAKLAQIDEMRYAVLVVVYGHIVKHRLILLIIWNPMNAIKNKKSQNKKQNNTNVSSQQLSASARERAHSHSNTVTFWQHKHKIKSFASAKKEMNINLHSKLAESMIISSLHRDGLIDDIIIRVTQTVCANEEINPLKPTAVPRQWTLRELKEKLSTDYHISLPNIRISLVPNHVNRKGTAGHGVTHRSRARTRTQSEIGWLQNDDQTLFDLGIDHGSQIYIHDIGNTDANSDDLNITNSLIKRDRLRLMSEFLFKTNDPREALLNGSTHLHAHPTTDHYRGGSMPNVHLNHFAEALKNTNYHGKKTSTPKLSLSFNMKTIKKRDPKQKQNKKKRSKSKKNRKKKKKTKTKTKLKSPQELLLAHAPRVSKEKNSISVGYLPEIRESITASTPPIKDMIPLSKSLSLPRQIQNIDQSVSTITSDEDFSSPSPRHPASSIKEESAPLPVTKGAVPAPIPAPIPAQNGTSSPSSSSSSNGLSSIALVPSASAPAPATAPAPMPTFAPAPLPLHLIGGSMATQPTQRSSLTFAGLAVSPIPNMSASAPPPPLPPPNLSTKKKRKLKTNLDALQASIDAKREAEAKEREEAENEAENDLDLQPSHVFTDLELKRATQSAPQLVNRRSFDLTGEEEELIPLPDTQLMSDSNLVQTESNIDLNDLFITSHNIGRGKTASVHQALYKDTVFVAMKEFVFQNLSPAILADFHKEANTLKNLRHPNIAQLVGSYLDEVSGELYIVLEWLPNGCLHDLLHRNSKQAEEEEEPIALEYYDVLLMAIDIARGMKYLHFKNIIHRDLKTHNLLLDEEYRVKVTDFGTAKHLEQAVKSKAFTEVGTLGYVAPEVLDPPKNGYDGKVDVFSYAVILWEIYSSYANIETDNVLTTVSTLQYAQRLKNGFRPQIPKDCPEDFKFLIDQCWQYKPQKRPTFAQIVLYLQRIIKKYSQENDITMFNFNGDEEREEEDSEERDREDEYYCDDEDDEEEWEYEEEYEEVSESDDEEEEEQQIQNTNQILQSET